MNQSPGRPPIGWAMVFSILSIWIGAEVHAQSSPPCLPGGFYNRPTVVGDMWTLGANGYTLTNPTGFTKTSCTDATNAFPAATYPNLHCCNEDVPIFDSQYHACGPGAGGISPGSAVSSGISGPTAAAQFENTVNKRYSCCTSRSPIRLQIYANAQMRPPGFDWNMDKFDCVENAQAGQTFNALWASTTSGDATTDAYPNALLLRDARGRMITGFYTKKGERCNQFGEVTDQPIQPYILNDRVTAGIQKQKVGGDNVGNRPNASRNQPGTSTPFPAIPVPTGDVWNADYVGQGQLRRPPDCEANPQDCLRCPVLVRAAFQAKCPPMPTSPTDLRAVYEEGGRRYCSTASTIIIHLRIEQIHTIAAVPSLKTFDTTIDSGLATTIDVSKILKGL